MQSAAVLVRRKPRGGGGSGFSSPLRHAARAAARARRLGRARLRRAGRSVRGLPLRHGVFRPDDAGRPPRHLPGLRPAPRPGGRGRGLLHVPPEMVPRRPDAGPPRGGRRALRVPGAGPRERVDVRGRLYLERAGRDLCGPGLQHAHHWPNHARDLELHKHHRRQRLRHAHVAGSYGSREARRAHAPRRRGGRSGAERQLLRRAHLQ